MRKFTRARRVCADALIAVAAMVALPQMVWGDVAAPALPDESRIDRTITVAPAATVVEGMTYPSLTQALKYAAAKSLPAGERTRIVVKSGVYREAGGVVLDGGGSEKAKQTLLVVEGEKPGGIVITGSSHYTNWKPVEGQPGVYWHEWKPNLRMVTYDVPHGPQQPLSQRHELVFVNGQRLTPVLLEKWTYSQPNWTPTYRYDGFAGFGALSDNSFGVAELGEDGPGDSDARLRTAEGEKSMAEIFKANPHQYPNRIFIKLGKDLLPEGKDISSLKIEVADLDANPASPGADNYLSVVYKNNLVLRNLKFTGFANQGHRSEGVVSFPVDKYNGDQVACQGVRLQNVEISQNANRGICLMSMKNFSVENCRFSFNGQNGASGGRLQHGQFIDSVWEGNNWRSDGFGSSYGWASANFKLVITRNLLFRRCDFLNGQSNGLWFDLCNIDNVMEEVRSIGNKDIGFFQEISPGPNLYKNCRAEANKLGLLIAHSRNVTVDGGVYTNNEGGQIVVAGSGPGNGRFSAYTGEAFLPDFEKVGITKAKDADGNALMGGPDAEYVITSGNNTVKNAHIATGMGGGSSLISVSESEAMIAGTDPAGSEEARRTFFKENWKASGNTYFVANQLPESQGSFGFGKERMSLEAWCRAFGETNAKMDPSIYRSPAIVVTTKDATRLKTTGEWKKDAPSKPDEAKDYYDGKESLMVDAGNVKSATATFNPEITVPGLYRVDVRWPAVWLNARNVPITISYDGGSVTQRWNMTEFDKQGWRTLGTFRFVAGNGGSVQIGTEGITPGNDVHTWTKTVRADAVRWVKVPEEAK